MRVAWNRPITSNIDVIKEMKLLSSEVSMVKKMVNRCILDIGLMILERNSRQDLYTAWQRKKAGTVYQSFMGRVPVCNSLLVFDRDPLSAIYPAFTALQCDNLRTGNIPCHI